MFVLFYNDLKSIIPKVKQGKLPCFPNKHKITLTVHFILDKTRVKFTTLLYNMFIDNQGFTF